MNRDQLLRRQLGIADSGAGEASLRAACRRFLAPSLAWKPTPTLISQLEQQGYWPELVEQLVPVFIINALEQNAVIQNIDAFFVEYIKYRIPKDDSLEIDLHLVKRALFQVGVNLSLPQLSTAKALYENDQIAGHDKPSFRFFHFCKRYAPILFG